jgi:raffinose/stachyose/melibiose transport system permease protein
MNKLAITGNKATPYLFILPSFILFFCFIAYPIVMNLIYSFYRFSAITMTTSREFVWFANFIELIKDPIVWHSLKNNVIFATGSVVIQVGGGLLLAVFLHRGLKHGYQIFRTLFFLPVVMSQVAVGLLWSLIYDPTVGLLKLFYEYLGLEPIALLGDRQWALYAVLATACWQYIGYCMVMILAGLQAIPEVLYESSKIEGSSAVQDFWYITLPSIKEVISVVVLITVIGSFKLFGYIWVMTEGGPDHATEVLTTYLYWQTFRLDRMGYGSTIASFLFTITLIFSVVRLVNIWRREGSWK